MSESPRGSTDNTGFSHSLLPSTNPTDEYITQGALDTFNPQITRPNTNFCSVNNFHAPTSMIFSNSTQSAQFNSIKSSSYHPHAQGKGEVAAGYGSDIALNSPISRSTRQNNSTSSFPIGMLETPSAGQGPASSGRTGGTLHLSHNGFAAQSRPLSPALYHASLPIFKILRLLPPDSYLTLRTITQEMPCLLRSSRTASQTSDNHSWQIQGPNYEPPCIHRPSPEVTFSIQEEEGLRSDDDNELGLNGVLLPPDSDSDSSDDDGSLSEPPGVAQSSNPTNALHLGVGIPSRAIPYPGYRHLSKLRRPESERPDPASSMLLYSLQSPLARGSDVWPNVRDPSNMPAEYWPIEFKRPDQTVGMQSLVDQNNKTFGKVWAEHDGVLPFKSNVIWPMKKLPTEVYENICDYLSRDDLKAMRLSCSEFDRMMAQVLFETAVVPFNTEIYDMVKSDQLTVRDVKGKDKSTHEKPSEPYDGDLVWMNEKQDDIYSGPGVDVFKGFGHRIKRFGMSFEVNGNVLARPPSKGSRDLHSSFWGEYEWPFEEYQRYEAIAGLEHAADESPKMRTAFSYLTGVKHLALSLDSGLGWLNGPDLSIHAKVFRRPPPVFYSQRRCPERKLEAQKQLWDYLSRSHTEAGLKLQHATLYKQELHYFEFQQFKSFIRNTQRLSSSSYLDSRLIVDSNVDDSSEEFGESFEAEDGAEGKARANMTIPKESQGVLYTMATISNARDRQLYRKPRFTPGTLSSAQIEWLLETDWAQRAFLSSYMLAVMDNPPIFASIRSLTFARLSSQFLPLLMRNDFWDALSSLNTFSLNVIPIWRHIMKDEAGYVTSQAINPSHSITPCYLFLSTIIAPRSNIKHLTVGWADGGENAQGLFSRNMHLLPSPVISREHSLSEEDEFEMVHFPHLENLILSNCWLGSSALMSLVNIHKTMSLKELTLDSVSLAIWPPPEPGQTLATGLPGVYLQHHATGPAQPPYLPPWQGTPREESWPHVIDVISPGRKLADDGKDVPAYPPADMEIEGNSAPDSVLQRITFISCGYAQVGLVDNLRRIRSSQDPYLKHRFREDFFRRRYFMLDSCMMKVSERYFGYIVQHMPDSELERLAAVWDLREGWDDAEKAEEAKFDGLLPGGTGRFSGVVERVI